MKFERWMEENYYHLRDKLINQIIMPGSHNSAAYKLDLNENVGSHKEKFGISCARSFKSVKNIIKDWTLTQNSNIYQQLTSGIRVFDFHLSFDIKREKYYLSNIFPVLDLEDCLDQILDFLKENCNEILILSFNEDRNHCSNIKFRNILEVIKIIKNKIGQYLVSKKDKFPTYGQLIDHSSKTQRIFLFMDYENKSVWHLNQINNPQFKTSDIDEKSSFLVNEYQQMVLKNNNYNIMSFTIDPNRKEISKDIGKRIFKPCYYQPNSLERLSQGIQGKYYRFTNNNSGNKLQSVSCFMTDFPTNRFINSVIDLNWKLVLKYEK